MAGWNTGSQPARNRGAGFQSLSCAQTSTSSSKPRRISRTFHTWVFQLLGVKVPVLNIMTTSPASTSGAWKCTSRLPPLLACSSGEKGS
jgi:hypothetical protein